MLNNIRHPEVRGRMRTNVQIQRIYSKVFDLIIVIANKPSLSLGFRNGESWRLSLHLPTHVIALSFRARSLAFDVFCYISIAIIFVGRTVSRRWVVMIVLRAEGQ